MSPPPALASRLASWRGLAGRLQMRPVWLALGLLVWLAALDWPAAVLTPELDPSWRGVIDPSVAGEWRFGHDLIYTYGPLGFLATGQYSHGHYDWQRAWIAFSSLAGVLVLGLAAARLPRPGGWLLFLALLVLPVDFPLLGLAAALVLITGPAGGPGRAAAVLAAPLLVALPLVKFTYAMGLFASLPLAAAALALAGRWKLLAAGSALLAAGFAGLWLATGQRIGDLPAFVAGSLEVVRGYPPAMALPAPPPPVLFLAVLVVVSVGLSLAPPLWGWWRRHESHVWRARLAAALPAAILLAWSFLIWKHGVTRYCQGHTARLFMHLPMLGLLGLAARPPGPAGRVRLALLALAAAGSALGLQALDALPGGPAETLAGLNRNLAGTVRPAELERELKSRLKLQRQQADLPETRARAAKATLDVFGNAQGLALLNKFNYRPRPAFQSFSAYTPALAAMNESFYRSPSAPEFVLFRVDDFDTRFPALDDGLLWPHLLQVYDPVLVERDNILMRRTGRAAGRPRLLETRQARLGEPVDLSGHAGRNLWFECDLKPALAGRLRAFAYQPALVRLTVTRADGVLPRNEFLFGTLAARSGCILSPLLLEIDNVAAWLNEHVVIRPLEIRLDPFEPGQEWLFNQSFEIRIHEIPAPPRDLALPPEMLRRLAFRFFELPPDLSPAPRAWQPMRLAKEDFLMLPPPSELAWTKPEGARRIAGRLGLRPHSKSLVRPSDGAGFAVDWQASGAARTRLAEWQLDPARRAGDRQPRDFAVALPPQPGVVFLVTEPGPQNDGQGDATGWAKIRFED
jgi:hypothetical protein